MNNEDGVAFVMPHFDDGADKKNEVGNDIIIT